MTALQKAVPKPAIGPSNSRLLSTWALSPLPYAASLAGGMRRSGPGRDFPAMFLQDGDGLHLLNFGRFMGRSSRRPGHFHRREETTRSRQASIVCPGDR
jgi:hypothetical protein